MSAIKHRIFLAAACGACAMGENSFAEDSSIKTLSGHRAPVPIALFHPGGAMVASGGRDGVVQLWDLRTDKSLWSHDYKSPVRGLAFTADGEALACSGGGFAQGADGKHSEHEPVGEIELLEVETGEVTGTLQGHVGMVTGIITHPDGKHLVSCAHDGFVVIWDLATCKAVRKLPRASAPIDGIALSPDGSILAMPSSGQVKLFETASGELLREIEVDDKMVFTIAFSPDGKTLVTGSKSQADAGKIAIWNPSTGDLLKAGEPKPLASYTDIAFSADGKMLVTSSATSSAVEIRDPETTKLRSTLSGHTGTISSVGFSPNGRVIFSTSLDKTVKFWRTPL